MGNWQNGGGGKGNGKNFFKVQAQNANSTVWIGGIPEGINHEEIKQNFGSAGTVKKVQLLKGGTGFAWFSTPAEATQAIAMFNGSQIGSSPLQVDVWSKKTA